MKLQYAENWIVISRVVLTLKHGDTGNVRHYCGGVIIKATKALLLVQYRGDPGYSLIHLDERGDELTDTYHDTVQEAYKQAAFEFSVGAEDWENGS